MINKLQDFFSSVNNSLPTMKGLKAKVQAVKEKWSNDPLNTIIKPAAKKALDNLKSAGSYLNPFGWKKHTLNANPTYSNYLAKKIAFNSNKMLFYISHMPIGDVIFDHALEAAGNPKTIEEKALILKKLQSEGIASSGVTSLDIKLKKAPPQVVAKYEALVKNRVIAQEISYKEKEPLLDWLIQADNSKLAVPFIPKQIKSPPLIQVLQGMYNDLVSGTEKVMVIGSKKMVLCHQAPLLSFLSHEPAKLHQLKEDQEAELVARENFRIAQIDLKAPQLETEKAKNKLESLEIEVEKAKKTLEGPSTTLTQKMEEAKTEYNKKVEISVNLQQKVEEAKYSYASLIAQKMGTHESAVDSIKTKEDLQKISPHYWMQLGSLKFDSNNKMYNSRTPSALDDPQMQVEKQLFFEQWGEKLAWLSPDQIRALSPNLIQHVPLSVFKKWNLDQLQTLSREQLKGLTNTQIKALDIKKLSWNQLQSLDPIVSLLAPGTKSFDLSAFTTLATQSLEEHSRRITEVRTLEQFKKIPPSYFTGHTVLQFIEGNENIGSSGEAVEQVVAQSNKNLFAQWGDRLAWLSPEQIKAIPADSIPYISVDVVQQLTAEQILALSPSQLKALTPEQWNHISVGNAIDFKNHALNPELIMLVSPQVLGVWSAEEVESLSVEQLNALTDEQVQALSVNDLTFTQLSHVSLEFLQKVLQRSEKAVAMEEGPVDGWGLPIDSSDDESAGLISSKAATSVEPLSERQKVLVQWCLQMADDNAPVPHIPDLGGRSTIGVKKLLTDWANIQKFKKMRREVLTKDQRRELATETARVNLPMIQHEMEMLRQAKILQIHVSRFPSDPEEIRNIPLRHLAGFLRGQVEKLTKEQLNRMEFIQIGALNPEYLTAEQKSWIEERAKDLYQLSKTAVEQTPDHAKLASHAFKLLVRIHGGYDHAAQDRVNIEKNVRKTLGIQEFEIGSSVDQIRELSLLRISLLTPNEIGLLTKDQLEAFTKEQVAVLGDSLTLEQLQSLRDVNKPVFAKKEELIHDAITRHKRNRDRLIDTPENSEKRSEINKEINRLRSQLTSGVNLQAESKQRPSQLQSAVLKLNDTLEKYSSKSIQQWSPEQIEELTSKQLNSLTEKQVSALTPKQKRAFTIEQLKTIKSNPTTAIHKIAGELVDTAILRYTNKINEIGLKEELTEEDRPDLSVIQDQLKSLHVLQNQIKSEEDKKGQLQKLRQKGGVLPPFSIGE